MNTCIGDKCFFRVKQRTSQISAMSCGYRVSPTPNIPITTEYSGS